MIFNFLTIEANSLEITKKQKLRICAKEIDQTDIETPSRL